MIAEGRQDGRRGRNARPVHLRPRLALVEYAMAELEVHFANEIAALRRLLAGDSRPAVERVAALWQEFIGASPA
jgi:hypothetical protein